MDDSDVIESQAVRPDLADLGRVPLILILRWVALALLALALVAGAHLYIATRLVGGLGLVGHLASVAWGAVWALFLSLFAALFARRLPRRASRALHFFSYSWMGLFALLVFTIAAVDLVSVVFALARGAPLSSRWGLLEVAAVAIIVVPAGAWGAVRALGKARIEKIDVPIACLPAELEGYRIVQLSDLHLGDTVGRDWAQRLVDQVNALAPDAVAITGDIADGGAARVRDELAPLGSLRAKDGVFFVTGNHEYYNGLGGWLAEVRRLGFQVLLNEHRVVHRGQAQLVVAGVTDYNGGEFLPGHASRPDLALRDAPRGAPRILLAHQPRTAFQAHGLDIDLQLSGHTHGGQFFPWKYFVRLQQPVLSGMARIGAVRVYTHRGTGFWGPPLRLMAPPEIAELRLVRAAGSAS